MCTYISTQPNSVRITPRICILFAIVNGAWVMPRLKFSVFKSSSVNSVKPFIITSYVSYFGKIQLAPKSLLGKHLCSKDWTSFKNISSQVQQKREEYFHKYHIITKSLTLESKLVLLKQLVYFI